MRLSRAAIFAATAISARDEAKGGFKDKPLPRFSQITRKNRLPALRRAAEDLRVAHVAE